MKVLFIRLLVLIVLGIYFGSCHDEPGPVMNPDTGRIRFKFLHYADGKPLIEDSMIYVNSAGNPYEVNELMYFISDVRLSGSDGVKKNIDEWKDIHYADIEIPSTLTWEVFDDIPAGTYDSITFIFGITAAKNKSFMFVNYPEAKMMWPDMLGGGYHYMMINGKWLDPGHLKQIYNFHLGIGQLYKSNVIKYDSIYAYVQNYFSVNLPGSSFTIQKDHTTEIEVIMNIDSWFKTPHDFDFNFWGGDIMQNQPAMRMAKENGADVFEVGAIR
ncbi:MAG TPA: MbnP family protein [Cyclobacteriaceae bacterium]|nr:MbnP family protein [Cyclobacteriaceae bacterium]